MCCGRLVAGQELHDVLEKLWEGAMAEQGWQRQEDIRTWLWALKECIRQVLQVKISAPHITLTSRDGRLSEHCRPGMSMIACCQNQPACDAVHSQFGIKVCTSESMLSMQGMHTLHHVAACTFDSGAAILQEAIWAAASSTVWS